jgi:hypothetical protein
MSTTCAEYISASEGERLVENLSKFQLSQVGSLEWLNQHEIMERLTVQVRLMIDPGP